jgi:hypothetical protein
MAPHQILFCPFCRESFEGLSRCPEHELELVPLQKLPASSHAHDPEDDPEDAQAGGPIAPLDPRHGRGLVALGAALNGAALVLPLGRPGDGVLGPHRTLTLCAVFPVLWTLLLVSFTLVFVLARRRTLPGLASLRLLVPALGLASPGALVVVSERLGRGPWAVLVAGGAPSPAALAVWMGAALMMVGGARLGQQRH